MGTIHGLSLNNGKLDVQLNDGNFERSPGGQISILVKPNSGLQSTMLGLAVPPGPGLQYDTDGKLAINPSHISQMVSEEVATLLDDSKEGFDSLLEIVEYLSGHAIEAAEMQNILNKVTNPKSGCGLLWNANDGLRVIVNSNNMALDADGIRVNVNALAGDGLAGDGNKLKVKVDDQTISYDADGNISVNIGNGLTRPKINGVQGPISILCGKGVSVANRTLDVTLGGGLQFDSNDSITLKLSTGLTGDKARTSGGIAICDQEQGNNKTAGLTIIANPSFFNFDTAGQLNINTSGLISEIANV